MALPGTTIIYRGWWVYYCEENGRRFWSTRNPAEGSWAIAQEFCSLEDAQHHIDERTKDR